MINDPPCETCAHYTRCMDEKLACEEFFYYLNSRSTKPRERVPTKAWYLLAEEGDDHK